MINEGYTYDRKGNVVITTLSEYIQYITNLKKENEGNPENFFFRGQANKIWDVKPSAFRNNILGVEHDLIQEACIRVPFEFGDIINPFERLTKLQHYGLPTRLLDVTMNPLVALYFACESCADVDDAKFNYENESDLDSDEDVTYDITEVDGIIYHKRAYGLRYNSKEIAIISKLTEADLSKGVPITTLWGDFFGVTTNPNDPKIYEELIGIIQKNYFVTSTFNNDRLIRQSGAFLLPGCFLVVENTEEYGNSIVQKTIDSLNKEFEETTIIIPYNCKGAILEELDLLNINKGSLFPELEHQMAYLSATKCKCNRLTVGIFEKIAISLKSNTDGDHDIIPANTTTDISSDVHAIIKKYISTKLLQEGVLDIINKETIYVDWNTKEAIISEMRSNIKRYLASHSIDLSHAADYATNIVKEIVHLYN